MNSNFAIVVNTHSSSKDVWPMFLGQLDNYFPNYKVYMFTDNSDGIDPKYTSIIYDYKDRFRTQYLKSIKQVDEDYILYLNEDYILYDHVNIKKMTEYLEILKENPDISFIRLARGPNFTNKKFNDTLYYLTHDQNHFFSQTAAIWRRDAITKVHELGPDLHIGVGGNTYGHFEVEGNRICREIDMVGLVHYDNEPKRGMYHYDSNIFPYVATAIIKGKWNIREYPKQMASLITKYDIDVNKRGTT